MPAGSMGKRFGQATGSRACGKGLLFAALTASTSLPHEFTCERIKLPVAQIAALIVSDIASKPKMSASKRRIRRQDRVEGCRGTNDQPFQRRASQRKRVLERSYHERRKPRHPHSASVLEDDSRRRLRVLSSQHQRPARETGRTTSREEDIFRVPEDELETLETSD